MKVRGVSDSFCREHVRSAKNTSGFSSVLLSELICVLYLAGKVLIGRSPCGLFEPSKDTLLILPLQHPAPDSGIPHDLGSWDGRGRADTVLEGTKGQPRGERVSFREAQAGTRGLCPYHTRHLPCRGLQKDYRTERVLGTDVPCWFVHNSGKGFIDGHYKDYLVPQLYSFLEWP